MGVRFAAQAGPHAERSGGPGCRDSSVDLAHAKTKAEGRSTLWLPFSILKRGETQDNNTWFLALTRGRGQGGKNAVWTKQHSLLQSEVFSFMDLCDFYGWGGVWLRTRD